MARTPAPEPEPAESVGDGESESARLSRGARYDALLDAAVALATEGDVETISMDAVAERAGVSRPLVYKHFANRHELLAAVYRREAQHLHDELAADVLQAPTIDEMFRVLIRGSLRAEAERGPIFAALRASGGRSRELRREQRTRDVDTVRAFARRVERELGVDRPRAVATVGILLGGIDAVLTQWRIDPVPERAVLLEDAYMTVVGGALQALASDAAR